MNLILRLVSTTLFFLYKLCVLPILWISTRGKKQKLPKISSHLLKINATVLAEKIRTREVSSEEICIRYINRIKEVNGTLNAVVEDRFESALEEARKVDAYLQSALLSNEELEKTKPLLGIPLTVKESCSVAGLSFCGGTLGRIGIKANSDGEAVAKLRESGAIILLVSNTPEICLSWESNNFVTGRTNNPYDITCTSSGSSGGEGALLGAGASLIGVGSDIAGSIRMPAMFNGVFGHKPTSRIISIKGHYPYASEVRFQDYLVIGPMTRYAKDLKLMTKIMADREVLSKLRLDDKVDLSSLRILFMEEEGNSIFLPTVQKDIKDAILESVSHFKNRWNSKIVENFKFKELRSSCEIAGSALYSIREIPNLLKGQNKNLVTEMLKSLLGMSDYTFNVLMFYTVQNMYEAFIKHEGYLRKNERLRQLFSDVLGNDGVFLYPTFTSSAFKHDTFLFQMTGVSYMMIFNTLGLPATHVPCGIDESGLPFGIQVIAGPHQDRLCFAVAEELEKYFGGWMPPS